MDATRLTDALEHFADVLPVVVAGVRAEDARWRGPGDAWSILEIVTHLADEEVDDFRRRLRLTLEDPAAAWPPIDPETWAIERKYNEGDLAPVLERFLAERRDSVKWLRRVAAPDWSRAHEHPSGPIRAGDLLASWAAHDTLHLRQIAKRLYQITLRDAGEYTADYAGPWSG